VRVCASVVTCVTTATAGVYFLKKAVMVVNANDMIVSCCVASYDTCILQHCVLFTVVGRYPNISCELLTSDVSQITDALVGCGTLFGSLMNFLESDRPLNPLQASFYGKLVALLISRRGELV